MATNWSRLVLYFAFKVYSQPKHKSLSRHSPLVLIGPNGQPLLCEERSNHLAFQTLETSAAPGCYDCWWIAGQLVCSCTVRVLDLSVHWRVFKGFVVGTLWRWVLVHPLKCPKSEPATLQNFKSLCCFWGFGPFAEHPLRVYCRLMPLQRAA